MIVGARFVFGSVTATPCRTVQSLNLDNPVIQLPNCRLESPESGDLPRVAGLTMSELALFWPFFDLPDWYLPCLSVNGGVRVATGVCTSIGRAPDAACGRVSYVGVGTEGRG